MKRQEHSCPACAKELYQYATDSVVIGCPHCGEFFDITATGLQASTKAYGVPRSIGASWMVPGVRILYHNTHYTLMSVYGYRNNWSEMDRNTNTWESGVNYSKEYFFENSKGEGFSIEYDDGQLYKRGLPEVVPDSAKKMVQEEHSQYALEHGSTHLIHLIGEDDEAPNNDYWQYKVVNFNGRYLTAEWEGGNFDKTVKYYFDQPVTHDQLREWRVYDKNDASVMQASVAYKNLLFLRDTLIGGCILAFLLLIFSVNRSNERLISESLQLAPDSLARTITIGKVSMVEEQTYECKAGVTGLPTNADAQFELGILRSSDHQMVSSASCYFYIETGTDSEGAWTEKVLSDKVLFRCPATGDYEFILYPDTDQKITVTADIVVKKVMLSRFYIALLIVLLSALTFVLYKLSIFVMDTGFNEVALLFGEKPNQTSFGTLLFWVLLIGGTILVHIFFKPIFY
jgi:hypothetical protein